MQLSGSLSIFIGPVLVGLKKFGHTEAPGGFGLTIGQMKYAE
jgi:hypothetical protein